ncbi:MAG: transglutaminase TgpA family protein [Natronomonas sp.]
MNWSREHVRRLVEVGRSKRISGPPPRLVALTGIGLVLAGFLAVLFQITIVLNPPTRLYLVAIGSVLAGLIASRVISPRLTLGLGACILVGGAYAYVQSVPGGFEGVGIFVTIFVDGVELLGGVSALRIRNADLWALAMTPVPVFLATYFGLRRRYVLGSLIAGGGLAIFVATGDASIETTLVGVTGVTLAIVYGDCDLRGEPLRNVDVFAIVLATMVLSTMFVGVIPGSSDSTTAGGGGGSAATIESNILYSEETIEIQGSIDLSPYARYTVEADRPAYWRVSGYDRYTGSSWVRTDEYDPYAGILEGPSGESELNTQNITTESPAGVMPAAWRPVKIDSAPVVVQTSTSGDLEPASPLETNESYQVRSLEPTASAETLRRARASEPEEIETQYTQLPESTPDRVGNFTTQLTADADTRYDTARTIETWLRQEREYSLDVDRPRGDIADAFLFEMEAGYCTYYATTMVAMLRTQGIPARFVTGYTTGDRIDENEWVLRGTNSHAWVEVYFPGQGWIEFDPTPADPRTAAERDRIDSAREDGLDGVDPEESGEEDNTTVDDESEVRTTVDNGSEFETELTPTPDDTGASFHGVKFPALPRPTPRQGGIIAIALLGGFGAIHRSGVDSRIRRSIWLRRIPHEDPDERVAATYRRACHLRAMEGREKRPGETPGQYFATAEASARRIGRLYERVRYGKGVTAEEADEAVAALARMLDRRSRIPHGLDTSRAEDRPQSSSE